jgi:Ca2+-binding RTX toxin-like protein
MGVRVATSSITRESTLNGDDGEDLIIIWDNNYIVAADADNNGIGSMLDGGAGIDTASYAALSTGVTVSLATRLVSGGDAAGDTLIRFENLTGSSFNDMLAVDAGNNVLAGGLGTDTLSYQGATAGVTVNLAVTGGQSTVGTGLDTLSGFENLDGSLFNDVLTGSSAANLIRGFNGDKVINGCGADILTGGLGFDRFVFSALSASTPSQPDIITDFVHGNDIIDLSPLDANTAIAGDQGFTFADLNPSAVPHSVTWSENGENTIIRADVNGDSTADFALVLKGIGLQLNATDFWL